VPAVQDCIMWHVCLRQELWSQQRQPLLGNSFANMSVARQQLRNMQQWSHWEAVFSKRSVPIATWCNNRRTVGRGVFYVVWAEGTYEVNCALWVSLAVESQLVQFGSCSWKMSVSKDRSHSPRKPRTLHSWKPLPSSAVKAVTENISLCVTEICKV
jgi:hypothetical protein